MNFSEWSISSLHWLCCTCWCRFWQSLEEALWKVLTCPVWHGEYILYFRSCIKGIKNQSSLERTNEMEGNNLAGPIQLRLFLWSKKKFTLQTAACCIIFPESHRLEWQNLSTVCSGYIVISPSFCNDKSLSVFFSGKTLFSLNRFNCLCVLKCPQMFS